jgi:hypothetical protein
MCGVGEMEQDTILGEMEEDTILRRYHRRCHTCDTLCCRSFSPDNVIRCHGVGQVVYHGVGQVV